MSKKRTPPVDSTLQLIALRNDAVYLPQMPGAPRPLTAATLHCLQQLRRSGFTLEEEALQAFNALSPEAQAVLLEVIDAELGMNLNWFPLVKGWLEPTGEDVIDHLATAYANYLRHLGVWTGGVTLPCGHLIPDGTFNMSRYNGCPFCGKPFRTGHEINFGQASKLKELKRWTDTDMEALLRALAGSSTPLDATRRETLKDLMKAGVKLRLPMDIPVKENVAILAAVLVERGDAAVAGQLMTSPVDVMRYLWYIHTGQIQIIQPRTMVKNVLLANSDRFKPNSYAGLLRAKEEKRKLRLHFDRPTARMAAGWLNSIDMAPAAACAAMHPRRGMWTRFIRALRLAEFAKKPGYERLAALLDTWWSRSYVVAQGEIDRANRRRDIEGALAVLKRHPGLFSRQLFSTILRYDAPQVLDAFRHVLDKVTPRLVYSLGNTASYYFTERARLVKTITGKNKLIGPNPGVRPLSAEERTSIVRQVMALYLDSLRVHYARLPEPGVKIYLDPILDTMALPVGDRSNNVQSFSSVLQGTAFPLEGDKVRLFLNWGEGMRAAPIDLDLSAKIVYPKRTVDCAYYALSPTGAKHSGDIREIPDKVGTAEYIELDVTALREDGAKYVIFMASNYSGGSLDVNARVGWMDSKYPMAVSDLSGVAYDPSTVQQMVRVSPVSLTRSLTFGLLDIDRNEVVWLELGSDDQSAFTADIQGVLTMLEHLRSKTSVGQALRIMAAARGMTIVPTPAEADRVYDRAWAKDVAQVITTLL